MYFFTGVLFIITHFIIQFTLQLIETKKNLQIIINF
jgi:hypothetical protein